MKRLKGRTLAYSIFLVLAISGYFGRLVMFREMSHEMNLQLIGFSVLIFILVWEFFVLLNRQMSRFFPLHKAPIKRVAIQLGLSFLFLSGIRAVGIHFIGDYFPFELNTAFRVAIYVVDFFFVGCVNAIFFILEYIQKWQESIQRADRLEREKTQVQFDNLKNQMNPHFLFNALSSLNSLIKTNPELASEFLQNMSKVYRYVLQHKEKNVVSLREELEFIGDYLFLLDTRFGSSFEFKSTIPIEKLEEGIVPVTFQILIENAIKHNTLSDKKPLQLHVFIEDDFLVMSNPVQKKNMVQGSNGLGLENLKNLYAYLSKRELSWKEEAGVFRIQIPLVER